MDEDLIAFFAFLAVIFTVFVVIPLSVGLSITSCIAYARTKKWDKKRNERATKLESEPLVASDDEDYDTEDEEENNKRKAEEAADNMLTFKQKFRKEFKKCWVGRNVHDLQKEKERDERKKLAKAVAKELDRRERRRERMAAKKEQVMELDNLPPYKK